MTPTSEEILNELKTAKPRVATIRAAGKVRLSQAVPLLVPWLSRPAYEFHAAEAAVALGRIGTPQAGQALLGAVAGRPPIEACIYMAFYTGPPARTSRPGPRHHVGRCRRRAKLELTDLRLVIGLLPHTFLEFPRFEDRLRVETERITLTRLLMERRLRQPAVNVLLDALSGKADAAGPDISTITQGRQFEAAHQRT